MENLSNCIGSFGSEECQRPRSHGGNRVNSRLRACSWQKVYNFSAEDVHKFLLLRLSNPILKETVLARLACSILKSPFTKEWGSYEEAAWRHK